MGKIDRRPSLRFGLPHNMLGGAYAVNIKARSTISVPAMPPTHHHGMSLYLSRFNSCISGNTGITLSREQATRS